MSVPENTNKQSQNNTALESKNDKDNPINYYEVIIDIDSFRHLLKEEGNNDWGWNVQIKDNFNYEEKIKDDYVSIGVVGNGNRGKSFLLSKISNFSFPIGYSVKTKGISVKYPLEKMGNQNIVILDSAGFETPVLETSDFKLGTVLNTLHKNLYLLILMSLLQLLDNLLFLSNNYLLKSRKIIKRKKYLLFIIYVMLKQKNK